MLDLITQVKPIPIDHASHNPLPQHASGGARQNASHVTTPTSPLFSPHMTPHLASQMMHYTYPNKTGMYLPLSRPTGTTLPGYDRAYPHQEYSQQQVPTYPTAHPTTYQYH